MGQEGKGQASKEPRTICLILVAQGTALVALLYQKCKHAEAKRNGNEEGETQDSKCVIKPRFYEDDDDEVGRGVSSGWDMVQMLDILEMLLYS